MRCLLNGILPVLLLLFASCRADTPSLDGSRFDCAEADDCPAGFGCRVAAGEAGGVCVPSSQLRSEGEGEGEGPSECEPTADPTERCDGIDNDCDEQTDEGLAIGTPCEAVGGEGAPCTEGLLECEPESGETICSTHPGGSDDRSSPETCDAGDNDCDGEVDEVVQVEHLIVTFSSRSVVEEGNTFIEISGAGAAEVQRFTGDELAGESVQVSGNRMQIRLISPANATAFFGYQVLNITDQTGREAEGPFPESGHDHPVPADDVQRFEMPNSLGLGRRCGSDIGECDAGVETCFGGLPLCSGERRAGEERCNGLDDDCDGTTDEGGDLFVTDGIGRDCGSKLGECEKGNMACIDGLRECGGADLLLPSAEVCNGLDDDCDSATDEANDLWENGETGTPCGAEIGECGIGAWVCVDGDRQCDVLLPDNDTPEDCDGRDNDCDGQTDEGLGWVDDQALIPINEQCTSPSNPCETGTVICRIAPNPEPEGEGPDPSGRKEACCSTDEECGYFPPDGPGELASELCDGLDNDCDGDTDEATDLGAEYGEPCGDNAQGACTLGTRRCINGNPVCDGQILPSPDVCGDDVDSDCDGATDDFDLSTDPLNCGACDNDCELLLPNADIACVGGDCQLTACRPGFVDADDNQPGCERPRTVFVDANADENGADGSEEAPFTTIQQALVGARNFTEILIAAGSYFGPVTVVGMGIQLRGAPDHRSEIKQFGAAASIVRVVGQDHVISGLAVTGTATPAEFTAAIDLHQCIGCRIERNRIFEFTGLGGFNEDGGSVAGIRVQHSHAVDIYGNKIDALRGGEAGRCFQPGEEEEVGGPSRPSRGGSAVGIQIISSSEIEIRDNTLRDLTGGPAVEVGRGSLAVEHRSCPGGTAMGIQLLGVNGVSIRDNVMANIRGGAGADARMRNAGSEGGGAVGICVGVAVDLGQEVFEPTGGLLISWNQIRDVFGGEGGDKTSEEFLLGELYPGGSGGLAAGLLIKTADDVRLETNWVLNVDGGRKGDHGEAGPPGPDEDDSCEDGDDNDANALEDCADPDCHGPACGTDYSDRDLPAGLDQAADGSASGMILQDSGIASSSNDLISGIHSGSAATGVWLSSLTVQDNRLDIRNMTVHEVFSPPGFNDYFGTGIIQGPGAAAAHIVIKDSIVSSASNSGIYLSDPGAATVSHALIHFSDPERNADEWSIWTQHVDGFEPDGEILNDPPQFLDLDEEDYRLHPESAAIDAGDPDSPCDGEPIHPERVCVVDLGNFGNTGNARAAP